MLDRESKREKILEGKLREIKIKMKKQQELQEARISDLLSLQAEKPPDEIKVQDDLPKVKSSLSQGNLFILKKKKKIISIFNAEYICEIPFTFVNEKRKKKISLLNFSHCFPTRWIYIILFFRLSSKKKNVLNSSHNCGRRGIFSNGWRGNAASN